jgi:hypothetical protein
MSELSIFFSFFQNLGCFARFIVGSCARRYLVSTCHVTGLSEFLAVIGRQFMACLATLTLF